MARPDRIDAVVTWVDGADPEFRALLHEFVGAPEDLTGPNDFATRYVSGHEIVLCIESIFRFAPMIDRVFVVTNGQDPRRKYPRLAAYGDRLQLVDHRVIYQGMEDALPVLNTRGIESMLWRIPDLSEYFLYFNDDMMLFSGLEWPDLFVGDLPRIYYRNRRRLKQRSRQDFPRYHVLRNSQRLLRRNYPGTDILLPEHYCTLWSVTAFSELYKMYPVAFDRNVRRRLRHPEKGFVPGFLHHGYLSATGRGVDCFAAAAGVMFSGREDDAERREKEALLFSDGIRFLCLNDMATTQRQSPDLLKRIETRILGAPFPPCEQLEKTSL